MPYALLGSRLLREWDTFDPAGTQITISTGVSAWVDKRASSSLAQGTPANQPTISGTDPARLITFDGSNDYLRNASESLPTSFAVVMVGSFGATTAGIQAINCSASTSARMRIEVGTSGGFRGVVIDGTGTDAFEVGTADTGIHTFILRNFAGVIRDFMVDGTKVVGARTSAFSTAPDRITVAGTAGASPSVTSCAHRFIGFVGTSLSNAECNALGRMLRARFSTPAWTDI